MNRPPAAERGPRVVGRDPRVVGRCSGVVEPVETTQTSHRRSLQTAVVVAIALLSAACANTQPSAQARYTFKPRDAAVQVDSPQLRHLKAAAGIDACPRSEPHTRPVGDGLPDITLPCLGGGRPVDLARLRGTPLVLNFWSQTCGPCRNESPILQQVHIAAGDSVDVIGVDWLDPRPSWAIAFADELGLTYPQIADPEGATRAPLRITTLPRTLFVTASGRLAYTEFAALKSAGELRSLIEKYLGVTVPSVRSG
jgi:cytochrome c biogenesis protein CcmG, thiol:disulfide interchange protein DsbE